MQPAIQLRRAIGLTLVVVLTTVSVLSAFAPVSANPVPTAYPALHQHADGTIHDHGSPANDGSVRSLAQKDSEAECVEVDLKGVPDTEAGALCTHGPDPTPPGYDIDEDVSPVVTSMSRMLAPQVPCDGDGTSGPRVQVIYARASDVADRYDAYLPSFQQWAVDVSTIFDQSAARTGGYRQVRFVHDASCVVSVAHVVLTPSGDNDFGATVSELQALGYNRTDRKYMLFVDANVYCGLGSIEGDDQPGAANANNFGPSYGRTDAGCWGGFIPAHELMHNLGGVQLSAPNSSGGWHCVDERDVMCYSDEPNYPTMRFECEDAGQENLFDCNNDDYYSTSPSTGSYLATHWNTANNVYLIAQTSDCPDERLEPDDSAETAHAINPGSAVTRAFCASLDEDWYSFAAVAGESYRIETLNLAQGDDTILQLYALDGVTQLAINDNSGGTTASRITWSANESGTYFVKIRRKGGAANTNWTYGFKISIQCPDGAFEPDNTAARARSITVPTTEKHAFCANGDQDWVTFSASANVSLTIETLNLAGDADTVLYLYAADGKTQLASNDDNGDALSSRIVYTPTVTGSYFVKAIDYSGTGASGKRYELRVESLNQAPDVSGPVQSLTSSALGGNTVKVKLAWSATDSNGVASYQLQQSSDCTNFTNVTLNAKATTTSRSLTPGTYQFRVRATDTLGVVSDWKIGPCFSLQAHDDNSPSITYSGGWTSQNLSGAYGGSVRRATDAGAKATVTFSGTSFLLIGAKGPERGKAELWLDGVKVKTVDFYRASTTANLPIYAVNGLADTTHTFEIRVLGKKSSASTGTRVDVDAIVVVSP